MIFISVLMHMNRTRRSVGPCRSGEIVSFTLPVRHSVSGRRKGWGRGNWGVGGALVPSQSEKRLAKDLRRLRMVSAFTSSWLRLARGAGVSGMLKVLVRDWDLL